MSLRLWQNTFWRKKFPSQYFASATFTQLFSVGSVQHVCIYLLCLAFLVCFRSLKRVRFFVSTQISWTLAWPFEGGPPRCASFGLLWSSANRFLINRYVDTRISIFIERFFKRDSFIACLSSVVSPYLHSWCNNLMSYSMCAVDTNSQQSSLL